MMSDPHIQAETLLAGRPQTLSSPARNGHAGEAFPLSDSETEAARKRQLYESLFESGTDGIFQVTTEGRILLANARLAEIAGYESAAQLIAANADLRQQLQLDPARLEQLDREISEQGRISDFQAEMERADGSRLWIALDIRAVNDASGRVLHYHGTVRDVSERKGMEDAFQQASQKWRALVESSGDNIVIATATGTVIDSNCSGRGAGIGRVGGTVFEGMTTASQRLLRDAMQRALQSGEAQFCELECSLTPPLWLEMRVVPIGELGHIESLILIGADATMRRRAEEALRESERFIARVADTSPAMLYVYDLLKDTYVYANHQITKILGYSSTQFVEMGGSFSEKLVHPDDLEVLDERARNLAMVEDGVVVECILRMKNADGHWLWIRGREAIFTRAADGGAEQIIGMAEDVTQRQTSQIELERSREQLRALSARLQEARETESAAIAQRVHDELGQSLTALNMDLCSIRKFVEAKPAQNLDAISEKVSGMTELVASMLTTVRQLGSELRPPILDQFGLLAGIQWQAAEFEKRFGIACNVTAKWRTRVDNQGVATAIFRILQEILTNVVRHAQATRVSIALTENAADLMLAVIDDGRGITEGQQLESLGILGMRERALLFGGRVHISGAPGKGTAAVVSIPRAQAGAATMPRKETLLPERLRKV